MKKGRTFQTLRLMELTDSVARDLRCRLLDRRLTISIFPDYNVYDYIDNYMLVVVVLNWVSSIGNWLVCWNTMDLRYW